MNATDYVKRNKRKRGFEVPRKWIRPMQLIRTVSLVIIASVSLLSFTLWEYRVYCAMEAVREVEKDMRELFNNPLKE